MTTIFSVSLFFLFSHTKVASVVALPLNDKKCEQLLAALHPDSTTARYGRLLQHLAIEKGAVTVGELQALRDSQEPIAPKLSLEGTRDHVYGESFRSILNEGGLEWAKLRKITEAILKEKTKDVARTEQADETAKPIFFPFHLRDSELPGGALISSAEPFLTSKGETELAFYGYASGWHFFGGRQGISLSGAARFYQAPDGTTVGISSLAGLDIVVLGKRDARLVDLGSRSFRYEVAPFQKANGKLAAAVSFGGRLSVVSLKEPPEWIELPGGIHTGNLVTSPDWRTVYEVKPDALTISDVISGKELFKSAPFFSTSSTPWFNKKGELFVYLSGGFKKPAAVVDLLRGTLEEFPAESVSSESAPPFLETADGQIYFVSASSTRMKLRGLRGAPSRELRIPKAERYHTVFPRAVSLTRPVVLAFGERSFLFDFYQMTVEVFPSPGLEAPLAVSSGNDGRLIGFFGSLPSEKISEIQLYGPVK